MQKHINASNLNGKQKNIVDSTKVKMKIFVDQQRINNSFCNVCPVSYQNQIRLDKRITDNSKKSIKVKDKTSKNHVQKKSLNRNKSQLINSSSPNNMTVLNSQIQPQSNIKMIYSVNINNNQKIHFQNYRNCPLLAQSLKTTLQKKIMSRHMQPINFPHYRNIEIINKKLQSQIQLIKSTQTIDSTINSYPYNNSRTKQHQHQKIIESRKNEQFQFQMEKMKEFQKKQQKEKDLLCQYKINLKQVNRLSQPPMLKKHQTDHQEQELDLKESIQSMKAQLPLEQVFQLQNQLKKRQIKFLLENAQINSSARLNRTGKLQNFRLRKTVSLKQKQEQEEQISQVIVGSRRIGRYEIMSNIQQNMEQSIMTCMQNSNTKQDGMLLSNF